MSSDEVDGFINKMAAESHELRGGATLPHPDAGPKELADALLDIRARLDRVEYLLQHAMRIRNAARHRATALRQIADDAWDKAITAQRNTPVRRDDYATGKERHAEANLAVMTDLRAARDAEAVHASCADSVELLRLHHRGLADMRQDVLALLRVFQFESNLER